MHRLLCSLSGFLFTIIWYRNGIFELLPSKDTKGNRKNCRNYQGKRYFTKQHQKIGSDDSITSGDDAQNDYQDHISAINDNKRILVLKYRISIKDKIKKLCFDDYSNGDDVSNDSDDG